MMDQLLRLMRKITSLRALMLSVNNKKLLFKHVAAEEQNRRAKMPAI